MGNVQTCITNEKSLWKATCESPGKLPIWHRTHQELLWDAGLVEKEKITKKDIIAHAAIVAFSKSKFNESLLKKLESLRLSSLEHCRMGFMNVFRDEEEAPYILGVSSKSTCGLSRFSVQVQYRMWTNNFEATMNSLSYEKLTTLFQTTYDKHCKDGPKIEQIYSNGKIKSDGLSSIPSLTLIAKLESKSAATALAKTLLASSKTLSEEMTANMSQIFSKEELDNMRRKDEFIRNTDIIFDEKSVFSPGGKVYDVIDPSRIESLTFLKAWVPALVNITNGKSQFLSEISGIPWNVRNSYLYKQLEVIFDLMLPMFSNIGIKLTDNAKVIVRSLMYEMEEGDEYFTALHKEGITNSIKAVGLYYPHVDNTLKGGELTITSTLTGGCGGRYPGSADLPVVSGTVVVFENTSNYHQVKLLTGTGKRWMIGFFVIPEDEHVPASNTILVNSRAKIIKYLQQMQQDVQIFLPDSVQDYIATLVLSHVTDQYKTITSFLSKPITADNLTAIGMD